MKSGWFGKSWGAGVCVEEDHTETPIGESCLHCGELFIAGDQGLVDMQNNKMHIECYMRGIIGGINHLRGTCSCCGGKDDPDPPYISKRMAAQLALKEWEKMNGISRT